MSADPTTDAVVCLITAPQGNARAIAEAILRGRLAACVNIVPLVHSVYRWEGRVQHDDEALLVAKTTRAVLPALEALLREVHPYDTFELVALDVTAGSAAYLRWIADSVSPPS